jgi:hypothetical protein
MQPGRLAEGTRVIVHDSQGSGSVGQAKPVVAGCRFGFERLNFSDTNEPIRMCAPGPRTGRITSKGRIVETESAMLDFGGSLDAFVSALFGFVNELLNGVFGWLADFFNGISITF